MQRPTSISFRFASRMASWFRSSSARTASNAIERSSDVISPEDSKAFFAARAISSAIRELMLTDAGPVSLPCFVQFDLFQMFRFTSTNSSKQGFQYSGGGKDVQHAIDVDLEMDDDEDFESGKRLVDPGESIASAHEFMKYASCSAYREYVTVS